MGRRPRTKSPTSAVRLAFTVVAAVFLGCGPTPSRVPRQLGDVGGVAVTNSPMLVRDVEPEHDGDRVWVTYSVVFENRSLRPVTLRLREATLTVSKRTAPVRCRVYGGARTTFSSGERWRVDCVLELDSHAQDELAHRDLDAHLTLPLLVGTHAVAATFRYPFRIEDAS